MPDPRPDFQALLGTWRDALQRVVSERPQGERALVGALEGSDSAEPYRQARRKLIELAALSGQVTDSLAELASSVEHLHDEWRAERRYTPAGLAELKSELEREFERRPLDAARRWLHEIVDAVRAREYDAVAEIAGASFSLPEGLRAGATTIRSLAVGPSEDFGAAVELWEIVANGALPGWEDVLDEKTRSRAHRLSAWFALRQTGDVARAEQHLDDAVELDPYGGPSHADRAALFLFIGELDRGAEDARKAIEVAPGDPAGYLHLGTWAELSGQFDDALELYRRGLERMPLHVVARIQRRASLLDPPGNLLLIAAEILLAAGNAEHALEAADAALAAGLRSLRSYPEADAYRLKARGLRKREAPPQAVAAAALEAGKRYHWNGETDDAIEALEQATLGGPATPEAGWFLADALVAKSFPAGAQLPDQEIVGRARRAWEDWASTVGAPQGGSAWAYLSRAVIADLEAYASNADVSARRWESVVHAERALVHDDTDGQAWGFAAKYLRVVGLEELAFESVERGYVLNPNDQTVLGERMAMLANRGRFVEAEEMASELVAMREDDAWVSGVRAWVALHQGSPEQALTLLETPQEDDPAWFYSLRALCYLALGEVPSALDDYQAVLTAPPTDGTIKCKIATACIALRDLPTAERWLGDARTDPTAEAGDYEMAAGFAALARDELETGIGFLAGAIHKATSTREVDDVVRNTLLRLRAIDDGDERSKARERAVSRLGETEARRRLAELSDNPPTPDSELDAELALHDPEEAGRDLGFAETALRAVQSRRHAAAGDLSAAVAGYERLRSSLFEPEASIALERVVTQASATEAARGNVEEVRRLQELLRSVGAADVVDETLAVASALESAGDVDEARRQLARIEPEVDEAAEREAVHRRLGELALSAGDLAEADMEISTALDVARAAGDHARVGQLETRLAMVAFARGDRADGLRRMHAALDSWRAAGAFEPVSTLVDEFRGFATSRTRSEWLQRTGEAVRATLDRLQHEGDIGASADADVADFPTTSDEGQSADPDETREDDDSVQA